MNMPLWPFTDVDVHFHCIKMSFPPRGCSKCPDVKMPATQWSLENIKTKSPINIKLS